VYHLVMAAPLTLSLVEGNPYDANTPVMFTIAADVPGVKLGITSDLLTASESISWPSNSFEVGLISSPGVFNITALSLDDQDAVLGTASTSILVTPDGAKFDVDMATPSTAFTLVGADVFSRFLDGVTLEKLGSILTAGFIADYLTVNSGLISQTAIFCILSANVELGPIAVAAASHCVEDTADLTSAFGQALLAAFVDENPELMPAEKTSIKNDISYLSFLSNLGPKLVDLVTATIDRTVDITGIDDRYKVVIHTVTGQAKMFFVVLDRLDPGIVPLSASEGHCQLKGPRPNPKALGHIPSANA